MPETQNQLAIIVQESGLDESKAQVLTTQFADYFAIAQEWKQEAQHLVVTDEADKPTMRLARNGRLFLKEKRVEIEKTRKQLKEESLKEGRAIDQVAKMLTNLIEPTEKFLEEQEMFAKRAQEKRAEEQRQLLKHRRADVELYEAEATDQFIEDATSSEFYDFIAEAQRQQGLKQAARQEEVRRRAELEAQRTREELAHENERLRQENENRKVFEQEQRAKYEAQLEKEREEAQRLRAQEIKRKRQEQEAEQQRLLMSAQAAEQQAAATDQEKLLAFAESIEKVKSTALLCTTDHGRQVTANVGVLLSRAANFLREQAQTLQAA